MYEIIILISDMYTKLLLPKQLAATDKSNIKIYSYFKLLTNVNNSKEVLCKT